ncbi:uncharacterized protein LOC129775326 [Toxorhynchites rutilus septentrionalis]|uniref:uncharacterized protein LOC129775326 n=1 Tax=Toxorhynchites rutilus septentrionalis TaxID=329112 RepID=UPI00247910BF|nr:uncharacterized protein LOC129775326 [Toxorhynchites rutilus septentrionalis]
MVQYASLYDDYVPFESERFRGTHENRQFLRRWDKLNGMVWVGASHGKIPENAVVAGYEGRHKLYVGRADIMQSIAPGVVMPHRRACFVAWGGKSHKRAAYEVLCTAGEFVPIDSTNTLLRGTPAGISEQGEPLYIGRAKLDGSLISGKIQRSYFFCYIPHKGKEVENLVFESEIFIKAS